MRPGIPLLAQTLREGGYETVGVVCNPFVSGLTGLDAGFETVFPVYDRAVGKGTGEEAVRRLRDWFADRRARGSDGRPMFLFVNLMDSHLPYTCDAESGAALGLGALDAGAREAARKVDLGTALRHLTGVELLDPATVRALGTVYDAGVRSSDRATGEILGILEAEGRLEHAFVAVVGDHGENLGEGGRLDHVLSVHEQTLHVPLVVRFPGLFEGGRAEDAQVRIQDLYPTILETAGLPIPTACGRDARSLAETPVRPRVAVAEFGPARESLPLVAEQLHGARPEIFFHSFLAVRDPSGRKYVETTLHPEVGRPRVLKECLFDLHRDPREEKCLLDGEPPESVRADAERLRALGR